MANCITARVIGGDREILDGVNTVGDVKREMGVPQHTAAVNGVAAGDDFVLKDDQVVTMTQAVKGGR